MRACPTFWPVAGRYHQNSLFRTTHNGITKTNNNKINKSHDVLSNFTVLCWASFLAIWGPMWPLGHGMNKLLNCPDKSKDMMKREMCALSLCYQTMETIVLKDMDYSQESNAGRKESMKLCFQQGRNLPLRKRFQRVLTIHQNIL